MANKSFKYIYGPVASWRLGKSLGVDLLSGKKKVCTFDCIYCQLGKAKAKSARRKLYVPTKELIQEISRLPKVAINYITFSGSGEPTLAVNLGQAIKAIKKIRPEPIAVLTNASLLYRPDVRKELSFADLVAVKLDTHSQGMLRIINQPLKEIKFATILRSISQFKKNYRGQLVLQIMLMPENEKLVRNIAKLAQSIQADGIYLGTPIRTSAALPLSRNVIFRLKKYFSRTKVISVYDLRRKKVQPISVTETEKRRKSLQ